MSELPSSSRTRIRRLPDRARFDAELLYQILDEGQVAHVAFVREGAPVVIPFGYARDGHSVLLHGSTGGGAFLRPDGVEVSIGVTHLDGLVFARSMFDSSMNYRSAVVFGRGIAVPADEKEAALRLVSDHLQPGRWDEVRSATAKELAATTVLRVPIEEASVKVRDYGASETPDDGEDRAVWAGVLPTFVTSGDPHPSASNSDSAGTPESLRAAVAALRRRSAE